MRQYTRQTIKRNFFAAMLLAPFVPVVLALGAGGYLFWSHARQVTLDRLALLSSHYVSVLDSHIEDCLGDLELVGVEVVDGAPGVRGTLARLRRKHPEIVGAALLAQDGTMLAYAGPSVYKGAHITPGLWLEEALERGASVGDVAAGQLGLPHFALSRRIALNERPVVLRVSLNPEVFASILTDVRADGVDVFLVNREGQVVAGKGGQVLTRDRGLLGPVFPDRIGQAFRDPESGTAFASGVMGHGGWILAVREQSSSVSGLTRSALFFVGLSALFGGVVVFLSSLYLSGHVEKMLQYRDEEREKLREQLYRAGRLAEIGEMAAGFAHEINNPLQNMKSDQAYMEMLLKDFRGRIQGDPGFDSDVEELMASLGQFRVQIDRCARITHSILNFGRAGAAEERYIDLAKFLPEVATMVRKKAELANIALKLDLATERLVVNVDAGRLQQVLLNLLNNAMYAVAEASDGRTGEIVLSCFPEGTDKVRVAIADNGVGIDPEQSKIIFTPFFTTKPAGSGTGLGLSLCHGLVDGMKGVLDFTSVKGQGSTFFIILPRVQASAV